MNNGQLYPPDQVAQILHAYRAIFPTITPELADYWGLARKRTWSCVTTNFHDATFEKLHALHERAQEIDQRRLDAGARGLALRKAAEATGVGYSIGISPWTDNLLARTYADDKESAVILLGHDWYPIVTGDRPSGTPLISWDSLHEVQRYWPGAPEAVLDGSTVGLFVNLYPDYRPPDDPKCGNLAKYGYSYAQCLSGLDALVAAVSNRFSRINIISWGANVWDALLPRLSHVGAKTLLTTAVKDAPGRVLNIELGGQVIPYLPLIHPGHWGNFGRSYHLRHVKAGFAALGLGLPGLANSQLGQVRVAREIALQ